MEQDAKYLLEAEKARLSLAVQDLRREIGTLKEERSSFVEQREREAQEAVKSVLEASRLALGEATETLKEIETLSQAVESGAKEVKQATEDFIDWKERERNRLDTLKADCSEKLEKIASTTAAMKLESMKLEALKDSYRIVSEQAQKDLENARKERAKLAENMKYAGCA